MKKEEFLDNNIYAKLFRMVYFFLIINVGFWLTTSPLFVLISLSALTLKNYYFFSLASLTLVPSIFAILKTLDLFINKEDVSFFKAYFKAFVSQFKKTFVYGLGLAMILTVCIVDIVFILEHPNFKLFLPFLILIMSMSTGVLLNQLYFSVRNPKQSEKAIWRIATYYGLKKWYITLLNVVILVVFLMALFLKPPVGFLILPSLLLFAVFWNCSKLHQVGEKYEKV